MWICLIILGICNNHILEVEEDKYLSLIKMTLNLERWHYWQDYVYGWFSTTLNKEAWQSVSRGSGAILLWRESQCKNAKVNKEWLLLRNKQRERACKVVSSVAQERQRWASFSSARVQCLQGHTLRTRGDEHKQTTEWISKWLPLV